MKTVRAAQIDPETDLVTGVVTCQQNMLVMPYVVLSDDHPLQSPEGWSWSSETSALVYVAPPITSDQVQVERTRRITAGFTFLGYIFDCDAASRQNISGGAALALGAMMQGALAEDLQWHGAADDFAWLAQDNTAVPMDAPTVFAFGAAAAEHVRVHIFAARALKDLDAIPANYTDNSFWPPSGG